MIDKVAIRDFRCLKQVDIELSPIHALVGPNDSGKSSILEWVQRGALETGQRVRLLQLDHKEMRRGGSDQLTMDGRGYGFAVALRSVLNDRAAWDRVVRDVKRHLPANISEGLFDISTVGSGALYMLAFGLQPHLEPVDLLLVEAPETGLHPHHVRYVVAILRRMAEDGTQVLMTTHSPMVINELLPHEVSVVTRTTEGTRVARIDRTMNFASRKRGYALGELWLAFGDGRGETNLVGPWMWMHYDPFSDVISFAVALDKLEACQLAGQDPKHAHHWAVWNGDTLTIRLGGDPTADPRLPPDAVIQEEDGFRCVTIATAAWIDMGPQLVSSWTDR